MIMFNLNTGLVDMQPRFSVCDDVNVLCKPNATDGSHIPTHTISQSGRIVFL